MTESTQPADMSKSAPAVDMSRTFSARVMALPLPAASFCSWHAEAYKSLVNPDGLCNAFTRPPRNDPIWTAKGYTDKPLFTEEQVHTTLSAAAAIAAEADALAEAARGLRVALLAYVEPQYEGGTDNGASLLKQARAALAAFDKAAGGAAPKPPVAWVGPTGQLMPHEIFVAWREQYPDQGHEHFRPLVYGGAA